MFMTEDYTCREIYGLIADYLIANGPSTIRQMSDGIPQLDGDTVKMAIYRMKGEFVTVDRRYDPRKYSLVKHPFKPREARRCSADPSHHTRSWRV